MVANLALPYTANWNQTDVYAPSYIANKPTITAYTQENSDWNSTTSPTLILNKPTNTNVVGSQGPTGAAGAIGPQGPVGYSYMIQALYQALQISASLGTCI